MSEVFMYLEARFSGNRGSSNGNSDLSGPPQKNLAPPWLRHCSRYPKYPRYPGKKCPKSRMPKKSYEKKRRKPSKFRRLQNGKGSSASRCRFLPRTRICLQSERTLRLLSAQRQTSPSQSVSQSTSLASRVPRRRALVFVVFRG